MIDLGLGCASTFVLIYCILLLSLFCLLSGPVACHLNRRTFRAQAMPGFGDFLERRKQRLDAKPGLPERPPPWRTRRGGSVRRTGGLDEASAAAEAVVDTCSLWKMVLWETMGI